MKEHLYQAKIIWIGNQGNGTSGYKAYSRDHEIKINSKSVIQASSDPSFSGNPDLHNPEELFMASLASCHMLWFLHLCSAENVIVTEYEDDVSGIMEEEKDGSGRFREVTLQPRVIVREERMVEKVDSIHSKANRMCFIANSCNFPVKHTPITTWESTN